MADPVFRPVTAGTAGATSYDAGLRAHMQRVYNYMAGGLAVTGLIAYVVAHTALATIIFGSPLRWLVMLGPLAFLVFLPRMGRYSMGQCQALFLAFCSVMGLSL